MFFEKIPETTLCKMLEKEQGATQRTTFWTSLAYTQVDTGD